MRTTPDHSPRDPDQATEESPQVFSLRGFLVEFRSRLLYTLPISLFIAGAWAFHALQAPPLYRSTAVVQVEPPERVVVSENVVDAAINSDLDFNTYLENFSSAELRRRVLDSLTKKERRRLSSDGGPDLGSLSVGSVERSFLIRVQVSHVDPAAAAFLANRYVAQFIELQFELLNLKNQQAVDYLQRRSEELLRETTTADQRLQDYMREHNLVSLDSSTDLISSRLRVVSSSLQQARLERISIEQLCDSVELYQAQDRNLLEIRAISTYGSVQELSLQLESLEGEGVVLAETYLARHPRMIALQKSIAATKENLEEAIGLAIADLQAHRQQAWETEQNLEEEYRVQQAALLRMRELAVEYRALESRAHVAKASSAAIMARLDETTTTKALVKVPLRLVDTAVPAYAPYAPNLVNVLKKGAWLLLVSLVGLTLVIAKLDDRIKSTRDIETILGETALGVVTRIPEPEEHARYRLILDRREVELVEPFMSLYAGVAMSSEITSSKAILVTGTLPKEGKSFISANLAASFAYHGKRTLIVDCDLRRPVLHQKFELPNESGLVKWYEAGGQSDPETLTESGLGITAIEQSMFLLPSGGYSSFPTPIFESPRFRQLIDWLKSRFDVVIIDTPPIGVVSDALHLAKSVDESIYVCRFNRASRRQIRLNLGLLRSAGCPVLGVVLNGVDRSRISHYSNYRYDKNYGRYYD